MEKSSRRLAKASASKPPPPQPIAAGEDHTQEALDEALCETFPASDPIAVDIAKPVVVDTSGKT